MLADTAGRLRMALRVRAAGDRKSARIAEGAALAARGVLAASCRLLSARSARGAAGPPAAAERYALPGLIVRLAPFAERRRAWSSRMGQATSSSQGWDPAQYQRFRGERARPFFDLVGRMPDGPVRRVADLGCGTGELTRTLLERWPQATVWGVDSSQEMLARAAELPASPRLRFVRADLARWDPGAPLDRIASNAALQWLPDHGELLGRLAGLLAPEGALGVQIPYHDRREGAFHELDQLVLEAPWRERLRSAGRRPSIETPAFYAERLLGLGLEIEMWETVYHHRMGSPAEIVEWMKGTALRPLLAALAPPEQAEFLDALRARVARLHPPGPHGVLFPFRRLFFVARRS